MPHCNIEGCARKYYAKGWCEMHYQRAAKHGAPDGGTRNHAPAEERFWRGVVRGAPTECWLYERGQGRGKYGRFQVGGKGSPQVGAHCYSYELHHGPIPAGNVVMHSCDTPRCVNPAHLSVGTPKQNTADMIAKGRDRHSVLVGEQNPRSVLNEALVRAIRASPRRTADLARDLNLPANTIRSVRIRRTWKHVA